LLVALTELRDAGNTVVVIEHNVDVIACCDWVIDLGPGGGEHGGRIVAEGAPEDVAATPGSVTGPFLRERLGGARTMAPGKDRVTRAPKPTSGSRSKGRR